MNFTFVRHAQSVFNDGSAKTNVELHNCRLSKFGICQAENLQGSFDLVLVSPLRRTLQTYTHSQIKTKEIRIAPIFREWKTSIVNLLEGEDERTETETEEQLNERVIESLQYLRDIKKEFKNGDGKEYKVLIISHHDFIYHFFGLLSGKQVSLTNAESIPFYIL